LILRAAMRESAVASTVCDRDGPLS
jgi:hypothetical protein